MIDHLHDLDMLVAMDEASGAHSVMTALRAGGARHVHTAPTIERCLIHGARFQPDVLIIGLTLHDQPTIELLRTIRNGKCEINDYLPVVLARRDPSKRVVKMALNCGVHEIMALPTNVKTIGAVLYRAVFVGRPFITSESYRGPCRRRRPAEGYDGPERRRSWAGYTHAAHLIEVPEPEYDLDG